MLVTPRVDEEMTGYEIINLTQVALGAKPAKGAHTLFIQSIGAIESSGWMILCFEGVGGCRDSWRCTSQTVLGGVGLENEGIKKLRVQKAGVQMLDKSSAATTR